MIIINVDKQLYGFHTEKNHISKVKTFISLFLNGSGGKRVAEQRLDIQLG